MKKTDHYEKLIKILKYRNYSDCTVNSYGFEVEKFIQWLNNIQNVNQRKIADILGHNSTKTSEIYQHISNKSLQSILLPC